VRKDFSRTNGSFEFLFFNFENLFFQRADQRDVKEISNEPNPQRFKLKKYIKKRCVLSVFSVVFSESFPRKLLEQNIFSNGTEEFGESIGSTHFNNHQFTTFSVTPRWRLFSQIFKNFESFNFLVKDRVWDGQRREERRRNPISRDKSQSISVTSASVRPRFSIFKLFILSVLDAILVVIKVSASKAETRN
jgi:hypothetical protein